MQSLPHHYPAEADGDAQGPITISSNALPKLISEAPAEFGGPGNQWSPETLLVAAVADCFVLTFRAIAGASDFSYGHVECHAEGVLDRVDRVTQFTEMKLVATLRVGNASDEEKGRRLLQRAEHTCLVSNSLKAKTQLEWSIMIEPASERSPPLRRPGGLQSK
jgi:peroxiredoxin-like protein